MLMVVNPNFSLMETKINCRPRPFNPISSLSFLAHCNEEMHFKDIVRGRHKISTIAAATTTTAAPSTLVAIIGLDESDKLLKLEAAAATCPGLLVFFPK